MSFWWWHFQIISVFFSFSFTWHTNVFVYSNSVNEDLFDAAARGLLRTSTFTWIAIWQTNLMFIFSFHLFQNCYKIDQLNIPKGIEFKIKRYIRRGANVNYVNQYGETPLIAAARNGNFKCFWEFFNRSSNIINRRETKETRETLV